LLLACDITPAQKTRLLQRRNRLIRKSNHLSSKSL
jgi:hypothetical protein